MCIVLYSPIRGFLYISWIAYAVKVILTGIKEVKYSSIPFSDTLDNDHAFYLEYDVFQHRPATGRRSKKKTAIVFKLNQLLSVVY